MTVIQPNSVAGINSITVQSGNSLAVHKANGELIRTITSNSGVSTFSSISVGTAATTNSAGKSINIGLGASISQHDANTLSLGTGGDERLRINSTGNVGLGIADPNILNEPAKFQELTLGGKTEGAGIHLKDDNGNVQGGLFTSDATGAMIVRTITNHPMMFRTNNTDIARFDSGGRLLLKTTTEGHAAADDLTIENTTQDMGMTLRSSSSHQGAIYFSDGTSGADEYRGIITYNHANDKLSVYTNASAALHITSSGDIDVGTAATIFANGNVTTSGISTFGGNLHVTGEVRPTSHLVMNSADNQTIYLGASNDLQLVHNGTDSKITDSGTGSLALGGSAVFLQNAAHSANMASFVAGAEANLFHNGTKRLETTTAGVTVTGTVTDNKGDVRNLILNAQSGDYTLVAADAGKFIRRTGGNITIPDDIFSTGNMVTILNDSGSSMTITAGSGFSLLNTADAASGNRTLAGRGMATILFNSTEQGYISGAGLS